MNIALTRTVAVSSLATQLRYLRSTHKIYDVRSPIKQLLFLTMSLNPTPSIVEGEAPFEYPAAGKPLKTWYKVTGNLTPTAIPLIILHGGPGVGCEAYNILSDLTVQYGIPIIQYDQVGCKRSSHLQEKLEAGEGFWNEELFIAELNSLIHHFGLDAEGRQYDIIGHSWGAMFGSSFAASKPKGLRKFIAWSSAPSLQLWIEAQNALRNTLPQEIQDVLDKCEKEGATNSPEYQGAMMQFYGRFMVRLNPPPAEILDGLAEVGKDPTVYLALYVS